MQRVIMLSSMFPAINLKSSEKRRPAKKLPLAQSIVNFYTRNELCNLLCWSEIIPSLSCCFSSRKSFFPKARNNNDIKIVANRVRFWQLEDNLDGPLGWLLLPQE